MTDKTQPEALRLALSIDLMDTFTDYQQEELNKAAAELRRQHARIAGLEAELEAVGAGGVQALSAAPAGWKLVPVEPTNEMQKAADEWAAKGFDWPKAVYRAMLAASPTPPADQQAPKAAPVVWLSSKQLRGVTALHGQYLPFRRQPEGRFDTPVYLEQAAPKAAPGEPDPADIIAGALQISRGHAIEMMREALEAAPQQEAQKPVAWYEYNADLDAWFLAYRRNPKAKTRPLVFGDTAPQPAPAPPSDDVVKDAARWRMVALIGNEVMLHPEKRTQAAAVKAYMDATHSGLDLTGAVDAAIAAKERQP